MNYGSLDLQTPQGWYTLTLQSGAAAKTNPPGSYGNRQYIDNGSGLSAWVDSRDGKGTLLTYNISKNTDKTIVAQDGLAQPVYWLTDKDLVYRVVTPQETADYAVSVDGGAAKKITDVTNTYGFGQGY